MTSNTLQARLPWRDACNSFRLYVTSAILSDSSDFAGSTLRLSSRDEPAELKTKWILRAHPIEYLLDCLIKFIWKPDPVNVLVGQVNQGMLRMLWYPHCVLRVPQEQMSIELVQFVG